MVVVGRDKNAVQIVISSHPARLADFTKESVIFFTAGAKIISPDGNGVEAASANIIANTLAGDAIEGEEKLFDLNNQLSEKIKHFFTNYQLGKIVDIKQGVKVEKSILFLS